MANNDKIQIKVELDTLKQQASSLKQAGGFKNNKQAENEVKLMIESIESLIKRINPGLKEIRQADALMNKLSETLLKIASKTEVVTEEFKKLQGEISKAEQELKDARNKRTDLGKKGRENPETGQFELYKKHQAAQLKEANIFSSKGRQITGIDTFYSKFDENGNPLANAFQNEDAAKKLYNSLKKEQDDAIAEWNNVKASIQKYENIIKEKTEALKKEGSGVIAASIIEAKIKSGEQLDSEKRDIYELLNLESATKSVQGVTNALDKQQSSLGKAFKQFTLYNVVIKSVKKALNEAVKTVQELDKYLTEQAMVTGLTRKQTYELVGSYQQLALQCGATTKEIAEVSTEYMKQGKTIEESLTLTKAAVSAAKVARVSVSDSVNYLTTALNGFRLSAEDAMKVSDKFAAVAASSATDYDELAIALSKVASQANLAGMSIDYTTALLTKGLETTREAPETMGTALKTIIARMRELGDYGETLEDGMDINNVEKQLDYIGIALRDQSGELRSTEDVLDELGKKWDTLNKNQQAAVAKALAGTRQQSRLIAMMEDYERVTELQEISQRSAGATAAQAAVYLEGMEASMNKIQVAWEKIVMTVSDSELIIGVFEYVGNTLDRVGDFLSNDIALVGVLITVGSLLAAQVGNKIKQIELSKLQQQYSLEEEKIQNRNNILIQKRIIAKKEEVVQAIKNKIQEKEALILQKQKNIEIAEGLKMQAKASGEDTAWLDEQILKDKTEIVEIEKEINTIKAEELVKAEAEVRHESDKLKIYEQQTDILKSQESTWNSMVSGVTGLIAPLLMVWATYKKIAVAINGVIAKKRIEEAQTKKNTIASATEAAVKSAGNAAETPGVGWIIAAAILAAAGLAIGTAMLALNGAFENTKSAENTAESINKLSNEIYKLSEKLASIEKITNSFDKLDNKIIKTNSDLKEMSSLLEQAGETLSEEVDEKYGENESEKTHYESLQTDKMKRDFLDTIAEESKAQANEKRQKQIDDIRRMSDAERKKFLSENISDASVREAQDAIYAINNNTLYEYLDTLKDQQQITDSVASSIETLTQNILEQMSAQEAWKYASDGSGQSIQNLANQLKDLIVEAKNTKGEIENINVAQILTSDDYSLREQVNAYEVALESIASLGDKAATTAFKTTYSQYEYFARLSDGVLDFIDTVGLSIDEINKLYSGWEKLQKSGVQITQGEFEERFKTYLEEIAATNGDIVKATESVFGNFLDESGDAMNAFVTLYGDLVQVGILNMGQNMDKIQKSINNFYDKAVNWSALSESDKAEFIQDNADMFSGKGGQELLEAFQSGNYEAIEKALSENEALKEQLDKKREEIRQELKIEEARTREDRNEAYIAQLKEYAKYLDDTENLFKASLEVRLDQEKKQLEQYKEFLNEQRKAEEESLQKRKDIYEQYFDLLNEEQEDVEYEAQAELLTKNLAKLASSTNASAMQQTKELEQKLADLESERLKELRERAQEAVLENMDDQLEQISEKFDRLLENNQAMLAAMRGDLYSPNDYIGKLITNQVSSGATANELQQYLGTLQGVYGSGFKGGDLEDITVEEKNNQLILNVNGQEIVLDTQNEQNLYAAIMRALTEIGLR